MIRPGNAAEPDEPGRQSQGLGRRRSARRPAPHFSDADFQLWILAGALMAEILDRDVRALKQWVREAWRHLADPSLTSFDRREYRNYLTDAEIALRAGLKRIADRERARREAERVVSGPRRLDFRILKLDT